jgi:hypothetical protein
VIEQPTRRDRVSDQRADRALLRIVDEKRRADCDQRDRIRSRDADVKIERHVTPA